MTPKQRKFAERIVAGDSPSEAYRAAYNAKRMSKHAISTEANKLLKHPAVSLFIEDGRREAAKHAVWSREMAMERLQAVNDAAFHGLVDEGSKARTGRLFIDTVDRLNDMTEAAPDYQRRKELELSVSAAILVDSSRVDNCFTATTLERLEDTFRYFGAEDLFEQIVVIDVALPPDREAKLMESRKIKERPT